MSSNNKKLFKRIAILGAAAAALAAVLSKLLIKQSDKKAVKQENTDSESDSDVLDTIDFASIGANDTREYVSIKINEHTA